jgi:hypothetical protein
MKEQRSGGQTTTMDFSVIPGRCEAAGPESRGGMGCGSGFRVRARMRAPRNDARALADPHHLLGLGPDTGDALDLERRAAGFLRDLAVLLD